MKSKTIKQHFKKSLKYKHIANHCIVVNGNTFNSIFRCKYLLDDPVFSCGYYPYCKDIELVNSVSRDEEESIVYVCEANYACRCSWRKYDPRIKKYLASNEASYKQSKIKKAKERAEFKKLMRGVK